MNTYPKLSMKNHLVMGVLGLIAICLSLDGKHYWHEIRFMYATTQFSMNEILSGEFNPHQYGGKIDEIGTGGFYLTKVATLWCLKELFGWLPPDQGGFLLSVYLSVFLMGLSGIITYKIFYTIFHDRYYAFLTVCCYLMIPITPYLSGKILSEVPAFFFITLCILFYNMGIRHEKSVNWYYVIFCGLFLLCAGLFRLDSVICFYSYLFALFIFSEKENRYKIIITGGIVSIIFFTGEVVTIISLKKGFQYFTRYFVEFLSIDQKSRLMSLLGILTFGGLVYLLAFASIFLKKRKEILLLFIWFSVATGIQILLTWGWMVEPRYLVPGLLPLIGIASIGLDNMMQKISTKKLKNVYVGVFIILATIINVINIRTMPYELDRKSIQKTVNRIYSLDTASTILVPWFYTDFHFLHVMYPNHNVINVHSTQGENESNLNLEKDWESRIHKWYGESYVKSPSILNGFFRKGPVYYLGWEKYPPVEDAKRVTKFLGLAQIYQYIDNLPLINHLTESWIWRSPAYHFDLIGGYGMYKYYRITRIK